MTITSKRPIGKITSKYRKARSLSRAEKDNIRNTKECLGDLAYAMSLPLEVVVAIRGGTTPPKGM